MPSSGDDPNPVMKCNEQFLSERFYKTRILTETLNDPGPNVIVLVLGMNSCPDVVDCNCLWPGIDEIVIQSVAR